MLICNLICIFCLLIFWTGCSREAPERMSSVGPRTNDSLLPTQLAEVKNGYQVMWRIVVTLSNEERVINHPTFPLVEHNTHWEDAKRMSSVGPRTLCIFIAEYVPIDALRVLCDGVEIPISIMKKPGFVQYLFFKDGVMLRVEFDKKIPDRVEVISIGRL